MLQRKPFYYFIAKNMEISDRKGLLCDGCLLGYALLHYYGKKLMHVHKVSRFFF